MDSPKMQYLPHHRPNCPPPTLPSHGVCAVLSAEDVLRSGRKTRIRDGDGYCAGYKLLTQILAGSRIHCATSRTSAKGSGELGFTCVWKVQALRLGLGIPGKEFRVERRV